MDTEKNTDNGKVIKSYSLKVEVTDKNRMLICRESDGFNTYELIGIVSRIQFEIYQQIIGTFTPEIISEKANRTENKDQGTVIKSYLVKVEITEGGEIIMKRVNTGFNMYELLGIITVIHYEFQQQIISEFVPDINERQVVIPTNDTENEQL